MTLDELRRLLVAGTRAREEWRAASANPRGDIEQPADEEWYGPEAELRAAFAALRSLPALLAAIEAADDVRRASQAAANAPPGAEDWADVVDVIEAYDAARAALNGGK